MRIEDKDDGSVVFDDSRHYEYYEMCKICKKPVAYISVSDPQGLRAVHPECWKTLPEKEK